MSYAIYKDWGNRDTCLNWENETTRVLRGILEDEENPKRKEIAKKLDCWDEEKNKLVDYYEETLESYEPIYNFIYPLETEPDEEKILEVALKTNCCIMYNDEENSYYLSLTSSGMDLSQDIALSYVIIENWIPYDLLVNISSQEGLSISKEDFKTLKEGIKKNIEKIEFQLKNLKNDWD